ncbi:MAG: hydrolase [Frankiales bacterium]|nr:hydrolase [Frankiales bacterium]
MGNGDGWVYCAIGHPHWGRFGAAGLLVVADGAVLLQHRAPWSHHGDTWGIPGGARDSHESAVEAALREVEEETGLLRVGVTVVREVVDDHGGWSYTTVVASAASRLPVHPLDGESIALDWVPLEQVADLELHPGFAVGWPVHLRDLLAG